MSETLRLITEENRKALEKLTATVEQKLILLSEQSGKNAEQQREALEKSIKGFQESFDKSVQSFNEVQREKFSQLESRQNELVVNTEKKLESIRVTVEEKLEKTLSERLGQSFETVGKQLIEVQKGLGEMQSLAQDVGGLKKVLSNVKDRGGVGEIQLEMLLEQILAPEQYAANVKTKAGSNDLVEFAVKLPGKDDLNSVVYLPIDAKFPRDVYEKVVDAYDKGEPAVIDAANKELENTIKKMAKDIRDKYIDPPHTTDFAIMFLPFESIYAEVIRRSHLLEQLQREFKITVTGPTTLAAILNSLQMGFRTLAIQKHSGEVWKILGAVKTEFEKFGGLLEKAQKHISNAGETLDQLKGTRTRAIQRQLRDIQVLPGVEEADVTEITAGDDE
ncbi:MAG: recombinase RmuC [Bacteroidetes bacterium GWF2_43_63]|nr:MAG: recombinase RmuC [Bacteroidetes bacterium GWE2_42_42]OFY54064.1 MAG: recombinase RmuC [Bacteroidetes bacterium GWF2_43_63]HCB63536.1 DNA recombination protein RmuC [Bacteroidales bacterium]HCY23218.1 DNA recombination protein RmuC [Bacteroidales bacterium]